MFSLIIRLKDGVPTCRVVHGNLAYTELMDVRGFNTDENTESFQTVVGWTDMLFCHQDILLHFDIGEIVIILNWK